MVIYQLPSCTPIYSCLFVQVFFGGQKVGTGRGNTKKDAQQKAAEYALQKLAGKAIMQFAVSTLKRFSMVWFSFSQAFERLLTTH